MFRRAIFHFTKPICACDSENLDWNIEGRKGESELGVTCATCDAVVRVPNDLFTACFEFETPYPGKQKKAGKAAQKSGPNDEWGKVIPFPSKGKNVVPFQPKKK